MDESTAGVFESAERVGHELIVLGSCDLLCDRVCDPWKAKRLVALGRGISNAASRFTKERLRT